MVPRTRTDAVALRIPRRRFTVDEYHRMGEAGVLSEDDRVELLDGEIVRMSPIGPPHASTLARLTALRGYREQTTLGRGRVLSPLAFPRTRFRVSEILG